ncbi:hypothetical protein I6E68_03120 [Salinibacterium sp. NSLL150]|uniref:hypothetical protein n=1 Tax=unclassified Salinibacterium TaxID=2632331 RepID=UPI0018CCABBD|nr:MULTISPECIES: hypothetical protein [unclassified Salinibacterium]MBH0098127.1 hypothetical protein [Salinibacterium sp. NSLL35]MBH0100882.1 hypothetical protein [Salinibacterium sp. NSLL150]MBH0103641.1 hypothetical protein [Salinibacterium sp. NSLL16]MBH0106402.1 hypothetical protein [Salinibacterium sp. NSLL17]
MTSSRRLPALISGAVALSLVLGGCSLVEQAVTSAGEGVIAHAALSRMVSELAELEGVDEASYDYTSDPVVGDSGDVSVIAASAIEGAELERIAEQFREGYTDFERAAFLPSFTLALADDSAGVLETSGLPESTETFVESFEFWRAASAAAGTELSVNLQNVDGFGGSFRSVFIPDESDFDVAADRVVENYTALQQLASESEQNHTSWSVAGIYSPDELAPLEFVELVTDLRAVIPLRDNSKVGDSSLGDADYPEGFQATWATPGVLDGISEISVVSNEDTDETWKAALQAATRTGQMENINFLFRAGDRGFSFHTSACSGSVEATANDDTFFQAVSSSGAQLAPGAGAGMCFPEQ